MTIEIRTLRPGDLGVLANVAPDVFDDDLDAQLGAEFLADPRHHITVAIDEGAVVGFASAIHYVHPDKAAELWINEVGVASSHHRQGIGQALLHELLRVGRSLGCREAWVLTDRSNTAAMGLYASAGGSEAAGEQVMFDFQIE